MESLKIIPLRRNIAKKDNMFTLPIRKKKMVCSFFSIIKFQADCALRETQYKKVGRFELIVMYACDRAQLKPNNKLFIKNITPDMNQKMLHSIFSSSPYKYYVGIITDDKGNNRNSGFIHFFDSKGAIHAIENFQRIGVKEGQTLKIEPWKAREQRDEEKEKPMDNKTLYINFIKKDVSKEKLLSAFRDFGEIVNSDYKPSRQEKCGIQSNYAVIEFNTATEAKKAISEALMKDNIISLLNSTQNSVNYFVPKQKNVNLQKAKDSKNKFAPKSKKAFQAQRTSQYVKSSQVINLPFHNPFFAQPFFANINTFPSNNPEKYFFPNNYKHQSEVTDLNSGKAPIIYEQQDSFYSVSNQTFQSMNNSASNDNTLIKNLYEKDDTLIYEKKERDNLLGEALQNTKICKQKK